MNQYDRIRYARDLLQNPLLEELLGELKGDIALRFPMVELEKLPLLQLEYIAAERFQTSLENLITREQHAAS